MYTNLSEKALSFLADYCNSVDPATFSGCDAAEQVDLIINANEPDVEYDRDEMIATMQEIINAANRA